MTDILERSPRADPEIRQILGICSPCEEFQIRSYACRLLRMQDTWFLKVFEDKRCRPRSFMESFLTTRLARRYGSVLAAKPDAEDIASEIVLSLFEKPPQSDLCSPDLIGLRRFLAARAVQGEIGFRRKAEGRMRCGNCEYHRVGSGNIRTCDHSDSSHPWSGKTVRASLDPRTFDPPCTTYRVRRRIEDTGDGDLDPLQRTRDPGALPDVTMAVENRNRLLLDTLRAIQQEDPKLSFVIVMSFFKKKTNEEIAEELSCSAKSVVRYKQRALDRLQQELRSRGVTDMGDLL